MLCLKSTVNGLREGNTMNADKFSGTYPSEYDEASSMGSLDRKPATEGSDGFCNDDTSSDGFTNDPFKPLEDLADDTGNILTFRAIIVGLLCGALVNASNVYLGLKSGWTASANLFAVCPYELNTSLARMLTLGI